MYFIKNKETPSTSKILVRSLFTKQKLNTCVYRQQGIKPAYILELMDNKERDILNNT